jgi:hypothetical protein
MGTAGTGTASAPTPTGLADAVRSATAPATVADAPAPVVPIALPMMATALPRSKLRRAFVFNPSFTPHYRTAHEELMEQMIDEVIAARMVVKDATPVVFIVPEGCDAVDLLYGPIEVTPGCGCDSDLDQIVTVGEAKLSANVCGIDGPLVPGDQIMVTVPWRAASWVDLEAGRLRLQVLAHFYKREQPQAPARPLA